MGRTGVSTICSTFRCWISGVSMVFLTTSNCGISTVFSATCDYGTCSTCTIGPSLTLYIRCNCGVSTAFLNSWSMEICLCATTEDNAMAKRTGWFTTRSFSAILVSSCSQHIRLIRASQLDKILVHESKDAFTDLLELTFHFSRRTLSRMKPAAPLPLISPSAQRW